VLVDRRVDLRAPLPENGVYPGSGMALAQFASFALAVGLVASASSSGLLSGWEVEL
jgi:hypothetical protein